jgi:serine/threonine-protein kinase
MGKYTPLARLGNGGMADVFLAVARGPMGFNKLTVVKRLRNSEENTHVQMFLDEARLAARLNHPNIVHTYEVGEVGGKYFIAMEYLEGQSLHQVLARLAERSEGLSDHTIALIAASALKGLHHAHELCDFDGTPIGVVHRDVSPHNLFLTYSGEIKLLDFGIAKATVNSTHTDTGVLKGKVRYMAPEQVTGKPVDRRLDLFAFGVVLWEMLARRPLFQGDAVQILTRIATDACPSVRSVRAEVSTELDAIVLRALRHDPNDRYQTADAMRADLEQFLRGQDVGMLEKDLVRLLNDLFAETRDGVRARIKSFLANIANLEDTPNIPGLMHSGELPALLNDSGRVPMAPSSSAAVVSPSPSPTASAVVVSRRGSPWALVALGAALSAALVVGIMSLRHSSAPPVVAPVAAPTTGRVRVDTTPRGALIEMNGRPLDRTPAELTLEPGTLTLVLSRDGYDTTMISVEVKAGETSARSVDLHEKPAAPLPTAASPAPAAAAPAPARPAYAGPRLAPPRPAPPPTAATPAPTTATAPATARPKIKVLDENDPQ